MNANDDYVPREVGHLQDLAESEVIWALHNIEELIFEAAAATSDEEPVRVEARWAMQTAVIYGTVALDYLEKTKGKLPHWFPRRIVYAKPETVNVIKSRVAYGWTPPPYDILAQVITEMAFDREDADLHLETRSARIAWLTREFDRLQLNNGWVESL